MSGEPNQPMRERSVSAEGESLYTMLDVPKDAEQADISRAYRKMALKHHPDKNPDNLEAATAKLQELNQAYSVLKDPTKRKIYDHWGTYGLQAAEHFGEDFVLKTMKMDNACCKIAFLFGFCVTGGCFLCFCCCCCCFGCCGKCSQEPGVPPQDMEMEPMAGGDGEPDTEAEPVVTSEPVSGGGF